MKNASTTGSHKEIPMGQIVKMDDYIRHKAQIEVRRQQIKSSQGNPWNLQQERIHLIPWTPEELENLSEIKTNSKR